MIMVKNKYSIIKFCFLSYIIYCDEFFYFFLNNNSQRETRWYILTINYCINFESIKLYMKIALIGIHSQDFNYKNNKSH